MAKATTETVESVETVEADEVEAGARVALDTFRAGAMPFLEGMNATAIESASYEALADADAPIHIHKDNLVGRPFAVFGVARVPSVFEGRPIELVIVAGAALDLDSAGTVRKVGRKFTFTAGSLDNAEGNSVLATEMLAIEHVARIDNPVFIVGGLKNPTSGAGYDYWTVRDGGNGGERNATLFDD